MTGARGDKRGAKGVVREEFSASPVTHTLTGGTRLGSPGVRQAGITIQAAVLGPTSTAGSNVHGS